MEKTLTRILIALATVTVSWFCLSFLFFPIKLSAPPGIYFYETMTHMVPLKAFITTVLVLVAIFIYEQKKKK